MPRNVSATEAKHRLGSILDWVQANDQAVIVENHGRSRGVIISFAQYESMNALKESARRQEALDLLRQIRDSAGPRNHDLLSEDIDALADRFSHGLVEDLAQAGMIRFEDPRP